LNALWIGPSGPTIRSALTTRGVGKRARGCASDRSAIKLNRRERERRLAAERKRSHGELANRILGQGATVKTEKLSYKAWQQRYGKSLKVRAPGMFVRMLERKAATGGELIEFATRNTCLSQFCHVDKKKPSSSGISSFRTERRVGRDLYCAFLARYVQDGCLDVMLGQVREA
jgi:putative transposase